MKTQDLIDSIVSHRQFCFVGPIDKFIMRLWLHWHARATTIPLHPDRGV